MSHLQNLIDQIDRLDQEATKGPWHVALEEDEDGSKFPWAIFGPKNDLWGAQGWDREHYIQEIPELTTLDAEFIALARTVLPQLAKAVKTVLEMHRPLADGSCDTCEGAWLYPCPTVRAITDAMEDQ